MAPSGAIFLYNQKIIHIFFDIIKNMAELVDVNKGDILEPLNKKGRKKKKGFLHFFLQFFLVFVFAVVLSTFGQLTYDFARYKRFYVNGESMYPTLNKEIKIKENGKDVNIGKTYLVGGFSSKSHSYLCDYGLMDCASTYKESIKRFSIVVTYFNSDYQDGILKENAELKIKRVIGMPGETLYFANDGLLYIKGKEEDSFKEVEQTFYNLASWNDESKEFLNTVIGQTNLGSNFANGEENQLTLKDGEYFLVGDNRMEGCSNDSRIIGPVNENCFVGRVVTIIGKCWFSIDENGKSKETIDLSSLIMPWGLELL